jgi:putative DNA primase/helicase
LRANPTKQDAEEALQELCEPFSEFPFASDEAKAAFLSHLLTSAVRHAIDVAPVYSYTAPLPGTGKSLLAGMAARIQAGALAPLRPYVEDSEELRKTLFAALLAGDTTLVLDNVPNGQRVRSPMLCGFVTAPVYSDRRLGVSEAPRLPNCCTVVMTGNNITAAGDLARRCIIVRLDANTESARGRDFKIEDLGRYVTEHRPRLLAAALTIVRAYVVAGCPKGFRPLPSFERWSRLARDPLTWLGCADPVDTQEQEADDELGPLRAAFAALAAVPTFAASVFTARQVAQFCGGYDEDAKALREIVEAAGCSDASNATKVGYWLRASRDRVAGGLKLKHRVAGQGVAKWKLESISF